MRRPYSVTQQFSSNALQQVYHQLSMHQYLSSLQVFKKSTVGIFVFPRARSASNIMTVQEILGRQILLIYQKI